MKDVVKLLKAWFNRIKMAVWLHPEFDASRRVVMFGAAAFVAAGMISQVPTFDPEIGEVLPPFSYAELMQITRRAFVPRLYVQLYKATPLFTYYLS